MGQYLSSEFAIYGRNEETNKYETIQDSVQGNPMSRFKHETYAYALQKKHTQMKALYLYCGYTRICRVSVEDVSGVLYINLVFASAEAAFEWDACREQIPKVMVDMGWLEHTFSSKYVEMTDNIPYCRRYQNYRMDMKK